MEAGLYQRLIEKCKSEEAKKSIQERYGFLIDQNEKSYKGKKTAYGYYSCRR